MIGPIESMSKNIKALEIKEVIRDSIRCLKGDQKNTNPREGLMVGGLKNTMKGTLKRLGMNQIITGNHKKIKK